jgi:TonB-linked SusC/RagA family outer membrane protein
MRLLMSAVILLISVVVNAQQNGQFKGMVTSEKGEALSGVTIVAENVNNKQQTRTTTNDKGVFQFSNLIVGSKYNFTFTYVSYEVQSLKEFEVKENEANSALIRLKESVLGLNDLVVVGYGTQRKSDLTGAVGSVKSSQLQQRPAINIEQELAGKIAGVNVSTNSGRPGGRTSIAIRGYSSINATNSPLYVVDGIINIDGINAINPSDVESIDVLKDASATAIYGTRGSNGVIIITTKRGSKSGSQVSYSNYYSVGWLPKDRKLKVLNSKEWLFLEEEVYKNAAKFDPAGFAAGKYRDPIEKRKDYLAGNTLGNQELFTLDATGKPQPIYDVDWTKESTRNAISNNHNLSFTGGDSKTNYGLYLGYANENGIIKESYQKRYNARFVIDQQMNSWLKVGGNLSYANTIQGGVNDGNGSYNVLRKMIEMVPFIPYKYSDGKYGWGGDYAGLEKVDNPLTEINENLLAIKSNAFNGNTYAKIQIMPGLDYTSTLGVNVVNNINSNFSSSKLLGGGSINSAGISSSEGKYWQWSNTLNYFKKINNNNTVNVLLGSETQKYNYLVFQSSTTNMPDDYYTYNNLGSGAVPLAPSSSTNSYQMQSYFGRFNYNLKGKYLLTGTGRFDGSSRFGANNKYAFFPSAAFGWKVSQEDFLRDSKTISNLKLRTSYGLTGNSEIGSYKSLASLSTNSYIFGGSRASGSAIGRLANPTLQWEKTSQFDVGFELGLLNNRINLDMDFYLKKTSNMLLDAPVPSTSGYTTSTRNIGNMENKGLEFSINTINIQRRDFTWSTNFNYSLLKNKITALGLNNEDIIYGFKDGLILRVGESVGSFYGYWREGIWGTKDAAQAATFGKKPGDVRIVDLNKDGVINAKDRTIIGKGIPDFYGTFTNSFRYKNFDLIVEIQYTGGNQIFNHTRNSGEGRFGIANNYSTVLNSCTPDNQDAVLEQVRPTGYSYFMDSRKVSEGSFIRGKNLALGYTLPASLVSKLKVKNLRFYISAQNFFLSTKYFGYDPELNNYDQYVFSQGVTYAEYPKPRTLLFGLNLNF